MNETIRVYIEWDIRRIQELENDNLKYEKRIEGIKARNPNSTSIKDLESLINSNNRLIKELKKEIDYYMTKRDNEKNHRSQPSYNHEEYPDFCSRHDDEYPCTW